MPAPADSLLAVSVAVGPVRGSLVRDPAAGRRCLFGFTHAGVSTSKLYGFEEILLTHQLDRSWLNTLALSNIVDMSVTLLT
jgi:hypothetical protein